MAYTKIESLDSLKNFDESTRLKALDILNAMLAEGYEESDAIPIATAQAKKWAEDATAKEKRDIKKKDITDHKASEKSSVRLMDADVLVQYREDEEQWEVRSKGAERADSLHQTKKEAESRAREMMAYRDGELIIKKKNE